MENKKQKINYFLQSIQTGLTAYNHKLLFAVLILYNVQLIPFIIIHLFFFDIFIENNQPEERLSFLLNKESQKSLHSISSTYKRFS